MKKLWELLALLIIGALLLKAGLEFIQPLIPYMVVVALIMMVGGYIYNRKRTW